MLPLRYATLSFAFLTQEEVMKKRNIALAIIFSIITFGIYGIFWYASMQNSVKSKCGLGYGGGVTVLFTILTFGLYGIYWMYAMGERLQKSGASKNEGVLYVILAVVGLGIVSTCLIQNEINKLADAEQSSGSW